jgi:hypothetical protein
MLDFLDIIMAIGEIFASWRFFLCVALAAGAVFLVYRWSSDPWPLIISIPIAVVALTLGILWQRRSG